MTELVRFGVAMDRELLDRFDGLCERRGYENRSEALRDLVRRDLEQDAWQRGEVTGASITLVYDHHVRELADRLTSIQHDYAELILASLHVHLDHHHCLEVIAARGPAREIKLLADRLVGEKGVLSGNVVAAAVPIVPPKGSSAHAHAEHASNPHGHAEHEHAHGHAEHEHAHGHAGHEHAHGHAGHEHAHGHQHHEPDVEPAVAKGRRRAVKR